MSGAKSIRDELAEQFNRSFKMIRAVVNNIPPEEWKEGINEMFSPAVIAYHTVESLDFYFCGRDQFEWGYRFRGPWWKTTIEELPTKKEIVAYLEEIEERVAAYFESCQDTDLLENFDLYDWSGGTLLGHFIYALRHTMHHQGQLAALQMQYGIEDDTWI